MNRRVLFGGIAAAVLLLTLITGAGIAVAAIAQRPSTDTGDRQTPIPVSSEDPITTPSETVTPTPAPSWSIPKPDPSKARTAIIPLEGQATVTDAEVRAYVATTPWAADDPDNARVWGNEAVITITCMAGKGWYYDPRLPAGLAGYAPDSPEMFALGGNTGAGDAYRWQDAGCIGLAVHQTGNDNNH